MSLQWQESGPWALLLSPFNADMSVIIHVSTVSWGWGHCCLLNNKHRETSVPGLSDSLFRPSSP